MDSYTFLSSSSSASAAFIIIACIGSAAAAAIKLREAILTLVLGINITFFKSIPDICADDSLVYISHNKLFLPHKLMTGVKVSPGRYRQILRS